MVVRVTVKMSCGHVGHRPTHDSLLPLKGKEVFCGRCNAMKRVVGEILENVK